MSACPPTAAQKRTFNHFGSGPISDINHGLVAQSVWIVN
jgi:hypothetical protein